MAVLHYVDRMTLEQVADMVGIGIRCTQAFARVSAETLFMEATA